MVVEIPHQLNNCKFIKTREKIPSEADWNKANNYYKDDKVFIDHLTHSTTYGVLCGVDNLVVVDIDEQYIADKLIKEEPFSNTFTVKTATKGLYHFYFHSNNNISFKLLDGDKKTLIDVQAEGKQVIGPNSVLSNGRKYEVIHDTDIRFIDYDLLKSVLAPFGFNISSEKKKGVIGVEYEEKDGIMESINKKIRVVDVLNQIGISTSKNPTNCPFHNSNGGKCFSFTESLWHCFHCEEKGNTIQLYMKVKGVDFITARAQLAKSIGLEIEVVKKPLDLYNELDIKKMIIYKSKEETQYKVFFKDFFVTLSPDDILNSNGFRKAYFNETGVLLPFIRADAWIIMVNSWMREYGQMIDIKNDANTETLVVEQIISDIESFGVVSTPIEALSFGRAYYNPEYDADTIFVDNKVIEAILRKNSIKLTMSKINVLLEDHLNGTSHKIRVGKKTYRFIKFKKAMLTNIQILEAVTDAVQDN